MKIRAAVLTSASWRHRYFHRVMAEAFDVRLALSQAKRGYYTEQQAQSERVRQHFSDLRTAEEAMFAPLLDAGLPPLREVADINDPALAAEAREAGVEVILLFGTAILGSCWLEAFPDRIVNLHLGLSPYYRGSATLFWPFAQNELECVGTTTHLAVAAVDAGPILARRKPDYHVGDTYYAITNRLIRDSIDALPETVRAYLNGRIAPQAQTAAGGRAWRKADFTEEALSSALDNLGAGLTAERIRRLMQSEKCPCSP